MSDTMREDFFVGQIMAANYIQHMDKEIARRIVRDICVHATAVERERCVDVAAHELMKASNSHGWLCDRVATAIRAK